MKVQIEDFLQNIDKSLEGKAQKDIYMIYIMIFAIIFAFSYLLFWDMSFQSFKAKEAQTQKVEAKIKQDEAFLRLKPELQISKVSNQIKKVQADLMKYKDYNSYIKTKIEEIPFLLYDERVWGEYLNSITKKARIYNIKLIKLTNKFNYTNQKFGHVLDIDLKVTGRYRNMIKFINSLENSDLVVDIHDINMTDEGKLINDMKISIWGIAY